MKILDVINEIILLLLGVSTLIGIMDFVGLLPRSVRSWFHLNRSEDMMDVSAGNPGVSIPSVAGAFRGRKSGLRGAGAM